MSKTYKDSREFKDSIKTNKPTKRPKYDREEQRQLKRLKNEALLDKMARDGFS